MRETFIAVRAEKRSASEMKKLPERVEKREREKEREVQFAGVLTGKISGPNLALATESLVYRGVPETLAVRERLAVTLRG